MSKFIFSGSLYPIYYVGIYNDWPPYVCYWSVFYHFQMSMVACWIIRVQLWALVNRSIMQDNSNAIVLMASMGKFATVSTNIFMHSSLFYHHLASVSTSELGRIWDSAHCLNSPQTKIELLAGCVVPSSKLVTEEIWQLFDFLWSSLAPWWCV